MLPRFFTIASLLLLSLSAAIPTRAQKIPPHKPAIVLFNGHDLSNFDTFIRGKGLNSDPDHIFQVEDGVIHISGDGFGYIITRDTYKDFYLRADFKWGEGTFLERKGQARDSGILFDTDQAALKPSAQHDLGEFARILREYPDTNIVIQGYTDSTGSADHNRKLSQARAEAVTGYLVSAGVERARLVSEGFGQSHAAASNATHEGRAKNRRVEIHIEANQELKRADAENARNA